MDRWMDGWMKDGWINGRVADTITMKHKLCIVFLLLKVPVILCIYTLLTCLPFPV